MSHEPSDLKPFEAILASLRVWLFDLIAALVAEFGDGPLGRALARELRAALRRAERDAKLCILALAVARISAPKPFSGPLRPTPGYAARRYKQSDLRLLMHGVFTGAPRKLRARIDRLRSMLESAEVWVARLVKHLARGFDCSRRILAAPPVPRRAAQPMFAIAGDDTS